MTSSDALLRIFPLQLPPPPEATGRSSVANRANTAGQPAVISISCQSLFVGWRRFRTLAYTWMISGAFGGFGRSSRVMPPFHFDNLAQVRLGRSVRINPDCWILTVRRPGDDGSIKLEIGAHSGIGMGATISAAKRVVLGDHVLLARNVYISDHGHAYADISRPVMDQGISSPAPVIIGRRSWLGQNVVVLPGVTIGEHCIIGANSVVNTSIPDYSLAVGVPARVVKRYNKHSGLWERQAQETVGVPLS